MSQILPFAAAAPPRLYAFDALRGLAAVAVVALHASYAYARLPLPGLVWPVPLDAASPVADGVFWAIEGAVMPLFFLMSGYFAARSLAAQPPGAVLAGRTRRLLRPMLTLGLTVLAVDAAVWGAGLILTGRISFEDWIELRFPDDFRNDIWGPAHLWYVEYLWLLCGLHCAAAAWTARRRRYGARPLPRPRASLEVALLAAGVGALLAWRPDIVLGFQHGWLPAPPKFLHAGLFFLLGARLHAVPRWLTTLKRGAIPCLLAAAAAFVLWWPLALDVLHRGEAGLTQPTLGLLLAFYALAATAGSLGATLRWLNRPEERLARLAQAAFWVYLVHHPLVGLCHVALRPAPAYPLVKAVLTFTAVLGVCLLTYSQFVRGTFVGRLLDGEPLRSAFRTPATGVSPEPAKPKRRAA